MRPFNRVKQLLALCGLALVLAAGFANAAMADDGWWQKDWAYRKKITIDTTPKGANIAQAAGRQAVLVRLHSGNFNFPDAQDSGHDVRFVASDNKTPLAFHVEGFDKAVGVATLWVDIPDFPVGGTKDIWLYYGNKNASAGGNPAATFDPDYSLVYHFDGAKGMAPRDQTAYGNNAQQAPGDIVGGGVVAQAAKFDGKGPISAAASTSLALKAGGQFTFDAWIDPAAIQGRAILLARHDGAASLLIGLDQGMPFVEASGAARLAATQALGLGKWSHLVVTADGAKLSIYVNGQAVANGAGALPALNGPVSIGGDVGAQDAYRGLLDEVRLSRIARNASAIYAEYVGAGPDNKLLAFGDDEKQSGAGFGYFGIIVQNVTIDAWVVIAILGLMALGSWVVMWTKTVYVGTVDRANDRFLELYRRGGGDTQKIDTTLTDERVVKRVRSSSIFRIYRAGGDEIARRTAEVGGRPLLHSEAIDVIRALMDATLIRENQKLSRNLVLLTISISGGPFLGLLGTVVGVMITFAAIAASGDVNINAIAPGISAALLATVAGLAVAIPALFGYNYLVIRNRNVSANMMVFVDEFVTRTSEIYSGRVAERAPG